MDDFVRLDVLIQIEQVACERAGMIAENMQSEAVGNSMVYDEKAFARLSDWLEQLRARIRN